MMMDKIICIGKNYDAHMLELGDRPVEKPVVFLKPPSVLRQAQHWKEKLQATLTDQETHYECELVIRLSKGGYKITSEVAATAIDAFTLGLDMTLRNQQAQLKQAGHPWTTAKVFIDSAITGPWLSIKDFPNYLSEDFSFTLDGEVKQKSRGSLMRLSPIQLVEYVSQFFPLCAGDIIFTGTPAGVGAVKHGSHALLQISNFYYEVVWG